MLSSVTTLRMGRADKPGIEEHVTFSPPHRREHLTEAGFGQKLDGDSDIAEGLLEYLCNLGNDRDAVTVKKRDFQPRAMARTLQQFTGGRGIK